MISLLLGPCLQRLYFCKIDRKIEDGCDNVTETLTTRSSKSSLRFLSFLLMDDLVGCTRARKAC